MSETAELWLRRDAYGERDDKLAAECVKTDLARQGYVIDRLKEISAFQLKHFWRYLIPVSRVVH